MDKSKFIDEYLEAVEKASVIPNIYCSKPYLLANENIIPYSDNSGLKGFIEKKSKIKGISFFLPPYSYFCFVFFILSFGKMKSNRYLSDRITAAHAKEPPYSGRLSTANSLFFFVSHILLRGGLLLCCLCHFLL